MQAKLVAKKYNSVSFQIAVAAIFAALVAVATLTFFIPIPVTGGYFNFGDTLIYVAALLFGPFAGLFAGMGAAIADVVVAPQYVLVTFVVKTIEGCLVGLFMKLFLSKIKSFTLCSVFAVLIGGFEMVLGYFVYESFLNGRAVALLEVPVNVVQMLFGLVIAVPIMHAVLHVFPRFKNYLYGEVCVK